MDIAEAVHDVLDIREKLIAEGQEVDLLNLCGGDEQLAEKVEAVLQTLETAEEALATPNAARGIPAAFTAGMRLDVIRALASGGQGRILLAHDRALKRDVAVKLSYWSHDSARLRIRKEAEIAARLDHPGVPAIFATGHAETGAPFFVMRYVLGRTLEEALLRELERATATGFSELEYRRLFAAYASACRTVDYAHSRGIVHCDLKTKNILLGDRGDCVVLDWGAAVPVSRSPRPASDSLLTVSHATTLRRLSAHVGTLCYVSPERFLEGAQIGPWTDVYSLGAVLLRMVRPRENPMNLLIALQSGAALSAASDATTGPPLRPEVLARFDGLWRQACAERQTERPESAAYLAQEVEDILREHPLFLA